MSEPWNGIPDDPQTSGWHWIGYENCMEAVFWIAQSQEWQWQFIEANQGESIEYLGPCTPPSSRCRDGRRKVAVAAEFEFEYDSIRIKMNDGDNYYMDGYYWRNGGPVFDVIGKTIPEMIEAAKRYRAPKQGHPAQQ